MICCETSLFRVSVCWRFPIKHRTVELAWCLFGFGCVLGALLFHSLVSPRGVEAPWSLDGIHYITKNEARGIETQDIVELKDTIYRWNKLDDWIRCFVCFCDLIFIDHCFWSAMWKMEGLYIYITKPMDYSNANVATRLKAKVKRKPTCLQLQQLTDWPTEKDSCLEFEFGHKKETGLFHLSLSFFHVDVFFCAYRCWPSLGKRFFGFRISPKLKNRHVVDTTTFHFFLWKRQTCSNGFGTPCFEATAPSFPRSWLQELTFFWLKQCSYVAWKIT